MFSNEGKLVTRFGGIGSERGQFVCPNGLVFDVDGFLYVGDYGNSRVQLFKFFLWLVSVHVYGLE